MLAFIRKSSTANPLNGGPIIVHCSAGVGRTGTYIVLDAMQRQIKHRHSVNVYGFLKHIRQQRNFLVQTEEQYIFIHDALLEAIDAGDTEVPSTYLLRYLQTLQTGEPMVRLTPEANGQLVELQSSKHSHSHHWPMLERQFRMVTQFKAKDFNVVSALKPCNKPKNRSLNLIPLEAHRVHILPRTPGAEGSDYINGTFLPGFGRLREFIITQHPIWDTVSDFWQMIWDHNVQTIVMLTTVIDEKEFPQFWPDREDEADYGSFKVKLTDESRLILSEGGSFITKRDLMLQSTQDDYELCCRLVHCADWPERQPLSQVFDLIKVVQEWCNSDTVTASGVIGPVVVVDRFGGTEAATFSILTTLFKQLNFEDCVDVYMYAKLYHLRRPGIWRSQDDYLFLYRALEALVSSTQNDGMTPGTPLSGAGTSNVNTLTSTSSATHLMGSNTPPPTMLNPAGGGTLPRGGGDQRVNSRNSSHSYNNVVYHQATAVTSVGQSIQNQLLQHQTQQQHHQHYHQLQQQHHLHNQPSDMLSTHSLSSDIASSLGTTVSSTLTVAPVTSTAPQQQQQHRHHQQQHMINNRRTPSPYEQQQQQLLSIQTTTGSAGYSQYHISMMPAAAAAALAEGNIVHA